MSHPPAAGTVSVWSDLTCPWASLAVHRLHAARSRLGLDHAVRLDHHAFPLELVNGRPTPKPVLDSEVPVIASREPALGWQVWQRPDSEWPGTVLVALEAVQAAKAQPVGGLVASEQLDLALRQAFFAGSRPIGLLTEVVDVARSCAAVDVDALQDALFQGKGRAAVVRDWHDASGIGVQGSPHVFVPDGTGVHNPGIDLDWTGGHGRGYAVITADDAAVYDDLLRRAAA